MTVPPSPSDRSHRREPSIERFRFDNSLLVYTAEKPTVPLTHVHLCIPHAVESEEDTATSTLVAETMMKGIQGRGAEHIARSITSIGGELLAGSGPRGLEIAGDCLADGLPKLMRTFAEILTSPYYPAGEISDAALQVRRQFDAACRNPAALATETLRKRLSGESSPYDPAGSFRTDPSVAKLREWHRRKVVPSGSSLAIVGGALSSADVATVEGALASWRGAEKVPAIAAPAAEQRGWIEPIARPASRCSVRLGANVPGIGSDDFPALQIANAVLGGTASSRLSTTLRNDLAITYTIRSQIHPTRNGTMLVIGFETSPDRVVSALNAVVSTIAEFCTEGASHEEFTTARNRLSGLQSHVIDSQFGLLSALVEAGRHGISTDWVSNLSRGYSKMTIEQVNRVFRCHLSPARFYGVVVGAGLNFDSPVHIEEFNKWDE